MEFPLAQICPQALFVLTGSHEAPIPTFSTFQITDMTHRSCRNLGYTAASPQALEAASIPGNAERAEEVPGEGSLSLQAKTRAWFQKTQAHWLLQHGAAPAWFHGFITRREAERLLEPKPQGCYLVRFSESAVTFVLTYRSRTCCRHFLLAQLGDGRHVVLGEDSAHERLQDLLRHYTAHPLSPYGETLTEPLARQTPEPAGLPLRTEESNSGSKSQDPNPEYSPIIKQGQATVPVQKEVAGEKEPSQTLRPKPPIPAKPQLPPEVYTSPVSRRLPAPPPKPSNPIYNEPDEPIAFYAMGRGSPGEAPSNIYVEVEDEGPPATLGHPVLRKSRSRPVPGGQVSTTYLKCPNGLSLPSLSPGLPNTNSSQCFPATVHSRVYFWSTAPPPDIQGSLAGVSSTLLSCRKPQQLSPTGILIPLAVFFSGGLQYELHIVFGIMPSVLSLLSITVHYR
ncbi:PREDICTED: SH2 domain-containing protein 2A isoform X2 [Cercocebus atys]|uniref:SH2 domain-containing protein 2A isoform X2 n=1 Tax=Cercocebus atys TaxID=9531 RepID=UPI0005F5162A|nr:PREDICTED: SH2 domain-containing protein 2A isoform X2 [Cercocebus atys]